jgi:hypothetical protein
MSQYPGEMDSSTKQKLNAIFDAYDHHLEEGKTAAAKKAQAIEDNRERVSNFLDEVVVPLLRDVVTESKSRGHEATLKDTPRNNTAERQVLLRLVPKAYAARGMHAREALLEVDIVSGALVVQSPLGTELGRIIWEKETREGAKEAISELTLGWLAKALKA